MKRFVEKLLKLLHQGIALYGLPKRQPKRKKTGSSHISPETNTNEPRTVLFLLHHLYRQQSLKSQYLKGVDKDLYDAISAAAENFEASISIQLRPVLLETNQSDEDADTDKTVALYDSGADVSSSSGIPYPVLFLHRPGSGALVLRAHRGGHAGNEPSPSIYRYFAGAMFISVDEVSESDDLTE